jgi:cytochrome P450
MPASNFRAAQSSYASPNILKALGRRASLWRRIAVWRVQIYLATHPWIYRAFFAALRKVRPILILGRLVIVTRHEDVKAVLTRDADFILAEHAEERMLSGSFLLNIDWPGQHEYEENILLQALIGPSGNRSEPARRIKDISARCCQRAIDDARRNNNEIDVTEDLAERVALAVLHEYYGMCVPKDAKVKIAGWLRDLASAILLLPPDGSSERYKVEQSAIDLCEYMKFCIEARTRKIEGGKAGAGLKPLDSDDVLTRLLKLTVLPEMDPGNKQNAQDWVRRYISGVMIFGTATIVRTATDTIDELLKVERRRVLADAASTVQSLKQALEYRQAMGANSGLINVADANLENLQMCLKRYVHEALRFRPMLPVLARYCPRATEIAAGRLHGRRVPAGATIVAPPISGMFDGRIFHRPGQFRIDRPLGDYLLFGAGLHECIGQFIADVELLEITRAVLELPGLRRAPGRRGQICYDGPAARHLHLMFDGKSAGPGIDPERD